mmetsp:Transcript_37844/g.95705  ORF Transcript_37844/g.95705 Transcript_37844/m.95705 type:complete len:254 (+) Transcript_37844:681-1442(+)
MRSGEIGRRGRCTAGLALLVGRLLGQAGCALVQLVEPAVERGGRKHGGASGHRHRGDGGDDARHAQRAAPEPAPPAAHVVGGGSAAGACGAVGAVPADGRQCVVVVCGVRVRRAVGCGAAVLARGRRGHQPQLRERGQGCSGCGAAGGAHVPAALRRRLQLGHHWRCGLLRCAPCCGHGREACSRGADLSGCRCGWRQRGRQCGLLGGDTGLRARQRDDARPATRAHRLGGRHHRLRLVTVAAHVVHIHLERA